MQDSDISPTVAANAEQRARWEKWNLRFPEAPSSRGAPFIRLIFPFRLWDDGASTTNSPASELWDKFLKSMQSKSLASLPAIKFWQQVGISDCRISELAPAAKSLFTGETNKGVQEGKEPFHLWTLHTQVLHHASGFGDRQTEWHFDTKTESREVPIEFREVECWASEQGLAYIVIEIVIRPGKDRELSLAEYLDVLHRVRYIRGDASRFIARRAHSAHRVKSLPVPGFIPEPREWQNDGNADAAEQFVTAESRDLLTWLIGMVPFESASAQRTREQSEHSFQDLAIESAQAFRAYAGLSLASSTAMTARDSAAEKEAAIQLVELSPADREIHRVVKPDAQGSGISMFEYSAGAYFAASRECTIFVAFDQGDDEFWRSEILSRVAAEYFTIQLLTIYQRHLLDELRRDACLADQQDQGADWQRLLKRARSAKARGFFVEISTRTNHSRFEHLLRGITRLENAYAITMALVESVSQAHLEQMHSEKITQDFETEKHHQKSERQWQILAAGFLPPTLVLTLLNVNIQDLTSEYGLSIPILLLFVVLSALVGLWVMTKVNRRTDNKP